MEIGVALAKQALENVFSQLTQNRLGRFFLQECNSFSLRSRFGSFQQFLIKCLGAAIHISENRGKTV